MDFKQQYQKELEKEFTQFFYLCGKEDGNILISKAEKSNIEEFVRLSCLTIIFGYKKLFMKIIAHTEKFFYDFMKRLEAASKNFSQIDNWTCEFIENIEHPEVQNLLRDFWAEQKANLELDKFNIRQFLK